MIVPELVALTPIPCRFVSELIAEASAEAMLESVSELPTIYDTDSLPNSA